MSARVEIQHTAQKEWATPFHWIAIEDVPFFARHREIESNLKSTLKWDEESEFEKTYFTNALDFLYGIADYCHEQGIDWYIRGSQLDALLLNQLGIPVDLLEIKGRVSDRHTYAVYGEYGPIPSLGPQMAVTGHIDVRLKATQGDLKKLADQFKSDQRFQNKDRALPVGEHIVDVGYRQAHKRYDPHFFQLLEFKGVPEKPSLLSLCFKLVREHVYLPSDFKFDGKPILEKLQEIMNLDELNETESKEIIEYFLTNSDMISLPLQRAIATQLFPYFMESLIDSAVYVIREGDDTVYNDIRRDSWCFNIDALQGVFHFKQGRLYVELPEIPDKVELSEAAIAHYRREIKAGNRVVMEEFIETLVRAIRKSQTFQRDFAKKTIMVTAELVDMISTYWTQTDFPHHRERTMMHNQELEVAAEINPDKTLELIKKLHLHKLMHREVRAVLEDEAQCSEVQSELIRQKSLTPFGSLQLERALQIRSRPVTTEIIIDSKGKRCEERIEYEGNRDLRCLELCTNYIEQLFHPRVSAIPITEDGSDSSN